MKIIVIYTGDDVCDKALYVGDNHIAPTCPEMTALMLSVTAVTDADGDWPGFDGDDGPLYECADWAQFLAIANSTDAPLINDTTDEPLDKARQRHY